MPAISVLSYTGKFLLSVTENELFHCRDSGVTYPAFRHSDMAETQLGTRFPPANHITVNARTRPIGGVTWISKPKTL